MQIARNEKPVNNANTRPRTRTNDNRRTPLGMGRSVFPDDAVARISRPARSLNTSAPSRYPWKLVFESRSPSFLEPLMGYTSSKDTLKQVELNFPTIDQATRYAERQGLQYTVQIMEENRKNDMVAVKPACRTVSGATLDRLGPLWLSESNGLPNKRTFGSQCATTARFSSLDVARVTAFHGEPSPHQREKAENLGPAGTLQHHRTLTKSTA